MAASDSREAWVWLTEYHKAHHAWLESGMKDPALAASAAGHLARLLERSPDHAGEAAALAMRACMVGRRLAGSEAVVPFVRVVREAMIHDDGTADQAAVVLVCYALALLAEDRRIEGLRILDEMRGVAVKTTGAGPFHLWTSTCAALLSGQLWEVGLERLRAQRDYEDAARRVAPIVDDSAARKAFVDEWVTGLAREAGSGPFLADAAELELRRMFVESAVGSATNLSRDITPDDRLAIARRGCRALAEFGPQPGMSPFVLAEILGWLDPDEAGERAKALKEGLERWKARETGRLPPPDIADPRARARAEDALAQNAERIEREWPAWAVASLIGRARAATNAGDLQSARALLTQAVNEAMASRLGLPQVSAIGALLALDMAEGAEESRFSRLFLMSLAATLSVSPDLLDSPGVRAMLDEPIAAVAFIQMALLGHDPDPVTRRRAAAIIDLIRTPVAPDPHLILSLLRDDGEPPAKALAEGSDLVGRIEAALAERPRTLVLIVQSLAEGAAFLLLSPGGPPRFTSAGLDYARAVDRIEAAAQAPFMALLADIQLSGGSDGEVRRAGMAAFEALPDEVNRAIRESDCLLLVADVRGPHPILPLELFHDGDQYLGLARTIARFTSLRHLAEALGRPAPQVGRARALVTAVSRGPKPLPAAAEERAKVQAILAGRGYDAPPIAEEKLSPQFFRDRVARVDVLHIAAHGESEADSEWLVLPTDAGGRDQRLTVDDFLERPGGPLPFVYLSTCNLARARYLGGGVGRGLAFTLAELGAPAVISNTTPVLDVESLALVTKFYEYACSECVGDALLHARQASGTSAATWGRAVLFGDPCHRLPDPSSVSATKPKDAFADAPSPKERSP